MRECREWVCFAEARRRAKACSRGENGREVPDTTSARVPSGDRLVAGSGRWPTAVSGHETSFDSQDQVAGRDPQGGSHLQDDKERRLALTTLHTTQVGTLYIRSECQAFLRDTGIYPSAANLLAEDRCGKWIETLRSFGAPLGGWWSFLGGHPRQNCGGVLN
jgi:hypothetical protein